MSKEQLPEEGPSPEELKKRKAELQAFYKGELPLLRLRAEYEELLTKIDVSKMQRLEIMMAKAEMMEGNKDLGPQGTPPQQENQEHVRPVNNDKPEVQAKGERKLKKVK